MRSSEIENCILKYLYNEATGNDLDRLSEWIVDPNNERLFDSYVQAHFEITMAMNRPDIDKLKKNLKREIKRDRKRRLTRPIIQILKYAAVGLLFMGLGYLYQQGYFDGGPKESQMLVPKEEAVTVETGTGEVRTLDNEGSMTLRTADGQVVGNQKGRQLVYSKSEHIGTLVYNTVNVPYGKQFDLVLSDGTHVYLNAGTSLKYPVQFLEGQDREVFLTGEAYFDVTEDVDHPFKVHADNLAIHVLGTKFNVSHYPENGQIQTVLVEGSVDLRSAAVQNTESTRLEPGYMAAWDKAAMKMSVENVDTRLHTAWVQGKLIFRNETFKNIRQALERKYNVTIINENGDLDEQRFDATFDIETIDEVLESFSKSYAIDYKIINNEVIIQ